MLLLFLSTFDLIQAIRIQQTLTDLSREAANLAHRECLATVQGARPLPMLAVENCIDQTFAEYFQLGTSEVEGFEFVLSAYQCMDFECPVDCHPLTDDSCLSCNCPGQIEAVKRNSVGTGSSYWSGSQLLRSQVIPLFHAQRYFVTAEVFAPYPPMVRFIFAGESHETSIF